MAGATSLMLYFYREFRKACQWFCHIVACFGLTFRILRWNTKVFVCLYWMPLLRFLGACVALAEIYGLSHLNIYNYIRSLIENRWGKIKIALELVLWDSL